MNGFIKLDRKFLTWEWYDDPYVKNVFIHCLLMANWQPKKWHGLIIERGQFITSKSKLAEQLNLDRKTVIRAIRLLEESGAIKADTNNHFTRITICKYDQYQSNFVGDSTDNTTDNTTDTTKERKEYKELSSKTEREAPLNPSFEEVKEYANQRKANVSLAEDFYDFYESNGWMVGKNPMRNWKASFNQWAKRHRDDYNNKKEEVINL